MILTGQSWLILDKNAILDNYIASSKLRLRGKDVPWSRGSDVTWLGV